MRPTFALLVTVVVGMATLAEPAAGDRVLARGAAGLSGHGGDLAFSIRRSPEGARAPRWYLRVHSGGRTRLPRGVPSRRAPFDVDLGPGPDGRTAAVYTRGNELRLRSLDAGRERRIGGRLPRGAVPRWPSVWRGRIAFVVRFPDRGRRARPDRIMTGPLGGPYRSMIPGRRAVRERGAPARAANVDLRGERLVYEWRRGATGEVEIRLAKGGRSTLVDAGFGDAGGEGIRYLAAPVLDGVRVLYSERSEFGIGGDWACVCVVAFDRRSRAARRYQGGRQSDGGDVSEILDLAVRGDRLHVAAAGEIIRIDPLREIRPLAPPPTRSADRKETASGP